MSYTLDLLKQLADGLARQFGPDCEIVIHDLKKHDLEHSIVHINNGHVTNRQEGDGPSKVVLETLHKDPASLKDHLGYLTRTSNGKILKSSTIYIRNEEVGYNNRLALPYIDSCGKRIKILQAGFVFREPVLIIRL